MYTYFVESFYQPTTISYAIVKYNFNSNFTTFLRKSYIVTFSTFNFKMYSPTMVT